MSGVFDQYALKKINVDWIHVSPWIPPRQLQNAIRVFARIGRKEKPLALLDVSDQGNGESGVLMTDVHLHSFCDAKRTPPLPLKYIRSILLIPDYNGASHLFVDGRRVLHKPLSFVDQIELKRFLSMLEQYVQDAGSKQAYFRVLPILGLPEENDLDDMETKQAIRILVQE